MNSNRPTAMADQIATIDPNVDPYGLLLMKLQSDGSASRLAHFPDSPASNDLSNKNKNPFDHISKDIPINQSNNLWVRVFVPKQAFDPADSVKFPLIVYFHGGGFVVCGPASSMFDDLYNSIAAGVPAVIVSVHYRLAPEHRLPAAYDDCLEALHWINDSHDEWLTKHADFSNCFLMGTSAGANICYNVGLKAAAIAKDLKSLEIKGLILHIPFFGGSKRTESELKLEKNMALPLCLTDIMWDLSLPVGVDRDHEFCNPISAINDDSNLQVFDKVKALGWKILVVGYYGDLMIDRQIEIVKKMEELDVQVVGKFFEGGFHGCDLVDAALLEILCSHVKDFIHSSLTSGK